MQRYRFDGAKLGQRLEEMGLTNTAFAEMLGQKQPAVSRWINGDQDPLSSSLIQISLATGRSMEWFMVPSDREKPSRKPVGPWP